MDSYELSDLIRRVRNLIRRGVIHSIQQSPLRCRVALGADPVTGQEHITGWLPLAAHSDAERQDWSLPAVGAPVTIFSEGGELRQGLVYPGSITDDQTPAGNTPHQHITRYRTGAYVMYDSETNHLEVSLPDGGTVTLIAPGGIELDGEVVVTKSLTVRESARVEGDMAVAGDITDLDGASGSLQDLREQYNLHDHDYNDGTTSPPNQPII